MTCISNEELEAKGKELMPGSGRSTRASNRVHRLYVYGSKECKERDRDDQY